MSVEIYSKLYLALIRSLQKKGSRLAVRQYAENYKAVKQRDYSGILGGSDSFNRHLRHWQELRHLQGDPADLREQDH